MPDTVEQADIRTLDIDKTVKGFAELEYVFKKYCNVSSTNGDSIRWYKKTAGDLTATAPSVISNVSPLSLPATLEVSWTRLTSYPRKYFVEGFMSMEDMKTADVDVYAQTLRDLTRAIVKAVDARIWDIGTESRTVVDLVTVATTVGGGTWNDETNGNPVKDLLRAQNLIAVEGYDIGNLVLFVSPLDYESLMFYIYRKGAQATGWGAAVLESGQMTKILNMDVVVSPQVTADYAAIWTKGRTVTWKTLVDTTAVSIVNQGIGTNIRVWEEGEALLTDPKSGCLITNTQT